MPPARRPILCYVTDLGSLPGCRDFSGPAFDSAKNQIREIIRNAATSGIDWIQIREKHLPANELLEIVQRAVADTLSAGSRILVNDRLDVALAAGAAGIHLGEKSPPMKQVAEWRRKAARNDFQIGVSCHSLEAAFAAERNAADYIIFGPVFATPSKAAFGPPQGVENLAAVCNALKIPVLAIGGVTLENARRCLDAGAAGIAAIRLFQDAVDRNDVAEKLRKVFSL